MTFNYAVLVSIKLQENDQRAVNSTTPSSQTGKTTTKT